MALSESEHELRQFLRRTHLTRADDPTPFVYLMRGAATLSSGPLKAIALALEGRRFADAHSAITLFAGGYRAWS
ncbi:MAG: hypothetical protein ACREDR_22380, partial [Blastocatellia bacterium]